MDVNEIALGKNVEQKETLSGPELGVGRHLHLRASRRKGDP